MNRLFALALVAMAACAHAARGGPDAPPVEPVLVVPPLVDAGASPESSNGVRFGRSALAVGTRWSIETDAETRTIETADASQVTRYASELEVEVLEASGLAPTRVRLRFLKNAYTYESGEKPTSLEGRSYVVGSVEPFVSADDGGPVSEEERSRVLDVFPDLGTRSRIDEVLPDDVLSIGDRRDDLAGAILHVIHPRAWTLSRGTAELVRIEGDEAIFRVVIEAKSTSGIRMQIGGEARVRSRDARLAGLTLDGTYEDGPDPTSTRGTLSLRRTLRAPAGAPPGE